MSGIIKSVYISPQTALNQQIAALQEAGAPITDFAVGSAARTLLEAPAIVVSSQSQVADQLKQDSYLETAEGEALDILGKSNWFVSRLPAVKAIGQLTITRQETSSALLLAAAWGQLTVPPAAPGGEGVAVLTTEPASFAVGQASVTIQAVAVAGGPEGNLAINTKLTPSAPMVGISSQEGYVVTTAFTGGVAEETDEAYRARIPLVVQARQAKGATVAFQAAALSVPGVLSVGVLKAGTVRSNSTQVPGGHLEVVYQGAAHLLSGVEAAVQAATTINQEATTAAAESLEAPRGSQRVILECSLVSEPGANTEALKAEAIAAATKYVNSAGMGGTAHASGLVEALHALGGIVSITLPLTKFAVYPEAGAKDIACALDQYTSLAEADCHITVEEL